MAKRPVRQQMVVGSRVGPDGYHVDVFRDDAGKPRCNAKLRGKDQKCRVSPILGEKRCRLHGGIVQLGPASPNYTHGLYSSWRGKLGIPTSDKADQSYLDLRTGIDSQMFVLDRCAERLAESDSPQFRRTAKALMAKVKAALLAGDVDGLAASVKKLDQWIHDGLAEDTALREMSAVSSSLSKQMEGAHRARVNAMNALNAEDAVQFVSTVVQYVREEVGVEHAQRLITRLDREVLGSRLGIKPPGHGGEPGDGLDDEG
tara:strand:- start:442 stop:1218 length:777 start_codon:yes stop_codon:yes gene_type:complete